MSGVDGKWVANDQACFATQGSSLVLAAIECIGEWATERVRHPRVSRLINLSIQFLDGYHKFPFVHRLAGALPLPGALWLGQSRRSAAPSPQDWAGLGT